MSGEREPIEVVACLSCDRAYQPDQGEHGGEGCCEEPLPSKQWTVAYLRPGSLDEAKMRLAEIVMEQDDAYVAVESGKSVIRDWQASRDRVIDAIAAVRALTKGETE